MANNNGWRGVLWKVLGAVLTFIVIGGITGIITIYRNQHILLRDFEIVQKDIDTLKENVHNIGDQVGDMHRVMSEEGWEGYSAWQWQLEMDRIYNFKLNLAQGEYPEAPSFLKNRPGYNGP